MTISLSDLTQEGDERKEFIELDSDQQSAVIKELMQNTSRGYLSSRLLNKQNIRSLDMMSLLIEDACLQSKNKADDQFSISFSGHVTGQRNKNLRLFNQHLGSGKDNVMEGLNDIARNNLAYLLLHVGLKNPQEQSAAGSTMATETVVNFLPTCTLEELDDLLSRTQAVYRQVEETLKNSQIYQYIPVIFQNARF